MIVKFCEVLFARIRERQGVYSERILSGNLHNFEDFRKAVGHLHGLKEAEEIVKKLYKDMFDTKLIDKNFIEEGIRNVE